jgi:hypothetical protein
MSTQDQTQLRDTAKGVVQRAINDPAFAEQLRSDPRATLLDAGMPEGYVDDFMVNDLGMEPEVAGYMRAECNGVTCILITCEVTFA